MDGWLEGKEKEQRGKGTRIDVGKTAWQVSWEYWGALDQWVQRAVLYREVGGLIHSFYCLHPRESMTLGGSSSGSIGGGGGGISTPCRSPIERTSGRVSSASRPGKQRLKGQSEREREKERERESGSQVEDGGARLQKCEASGRTAELDMEPL
ncbi:hypothetical protein EYF80_031908 [Liparis tanakae]|uniref:Uncharacterized protein n=1 Tax=Liparis tanakae TaxID=230148 RepID=A0A4Z2GWS8_9TELE|nr:hypothetical protein EYF80_031908 [Liparis tanakae]